MVLPRPFGEPQAHRPGGRPWAMPKAKEAEVEDQETGVWNVSLGRGGLEVKAGRHLYVSMSHTLLFWLISVAGTVGTSPYWTTLIK